MWGQIAQIGLQVGMAALGGSQARKEAARAERAAQEAARRRYDLQMAGLRRGVTSQTGRLQQSNLRAIHAGHKEARIEGAAVTTSLLARQDARQREQEMAGFGSARKAQGGDAALGQALLQREQMKLKREVAMEQMMGQNMASLANVQQEGFFRASDSLTQRNEAYEAAKLQRSESNKAARSSMWAGIAKAALPGLGSALGEALSPESDADKPNEVDPNSFKEQQFERPNEGESLWQDLKNKGADIKDSLGEKWEYLSGQEYTSDAEAWKTGKVNAEKAAFNDLMNFESSQSAPSAPSAPSGVQTHSEWETGDSLFGAFGF